MIEAALVTVLPAGFLVVLFGGGALFLQKNIRQDGEAPIDRRLFSAGKYSILVLWGAMVLSGWGIGMSMIEVPRLIRLVALLLWSAGFALMYIGRFSLGNSFRLGTPREKTSLKVDGLFRLSRNPMYVGMYATVAAPALYTANPALVLLAIFVVAVHHGIVLAEERHLQETFHRDYSEYCGRVPRYIGLPASR